MGSLPRPPDHEELCFLDEADYEIVAALSPPPRTVPEDLGPLPMTLVIELLDGTDVDALVLSLGPTQTNG